MNININFEQIGKLEAILTSLKYDSMNENDAFGNSPADKQIKSIMETLKVFGARFIYEGPDFTARIIIDD